MHLIPEKKSISNIFNIGDEIVYKIPIYQRSYSWRDENIETLFDDMLRESEGYYIGNLIVTPSGDSDEVYEVVDGQQRITTISLILLALYKNFLSLRSEESISRDLANDISSVLGKLKHHLITEEGNIRLELLEDDAVIYKDLLHIVRNDDDTNYTPHRKRIFGKRFYFIDSLITNYLSEYIDHTTKYEKLNSLYKRIKKLSILQIKVENLTDAFTIFTSFNAKGLPLTLIDLLKSYYLSNAVKHSSEYDALYQWNKLIEIFYDSNDEPISNLVTQFLQNNYDAYESDSTSSITKTQALKQYEKLFAQKGSNYINNLIEKAKIFSSFTNGIDKDFELLKYSKDIKNRISKLYKLDTTTLYPILLIILENYNKEKLSETKTLKILDFLIKYFVRRNIVLKPKSSNLRAKVLLTIREFEKNGCNPLNLYDTLVNNLMSIAASDLEFSSALKGDVYETNKNTVRLMLTELEFENNKTINKQKPLTFDDIDEKGNYRWTLEHIMPQTIDPNSGWLETLNPDSDLDDDQVKKTTQRVCS